MKSTPVPTRIARTFLKAALGARLPVTSGTIDLRGHGLKQTTIIRRDRWGIPHIEAQNDADAWFALGFAQGQDRAFQIEVMR